MFFFLSLADTTISRTVAGSFFLTGYCVPIHQQRVHIRQDIVRSWTTSRLTAIRLLAKSIVMIAQKTFLQTNPLFRELTGYRDTPEDYRPGPDVDFNFLQFDSGDEPVTLEADVVIVGSGCGGAVCAKNLAEAGHRVLVVDKSHYFQPSQLPMAQDAACHYLFENAGFIGTDDASVNVLAGSCWGGGGTVNWSVSLQTQGFVRKEWAEERGLPFFTSELFQDSLDRVCDFMGVSNEHIRHNHRNKAMKDGSRRLGWHAVEVPQNTGGTEHYCGQCHLGCGSADKKGTAVSWLPAAARAGAQCIEGFKVDRVTFEDSEDSRRATGVVGSWISRDADGGVTGPVEERTTRQIIIKAKKVIIAGGSLNSPLLLLKSGLKVIGP
jgi:hypothetical protein